MPGFVGLIRARSRRIPRGAWLSVALVLVGGVGLLALFSSGWPYRELAGTEKALPLSFHPDGQQLATWSEAGIDLFDVATGKRRAHWPRLGDHDWRLGWFSPDGRSFIARAITMETNLVHPLDIIDVASGTIRGGVELPTWTLIFTNFCEDGRIFRTVCNGKAGCFVIDVELDPVRVRSQRRLSFPPNLTPQAVSDDGTCLAVASEIPGSRPFAGSLVVTLWDLEHDREIAQLSTTPSRSARRPLAFAPGGQTLAVAQQDGSVELWDIPARRLRSTLRPHAPGYNASHLEFTSDGSKLVSWGELTQHSFSSDTVRTVVSHLLGRPNPGWATELAVADVRTGQRLHSTDGEGFRFVLSPDGRMLATVSDSRISPVRLRTIP